MFDRILVANDGSAGGEKALSAALELAKRLGVELSMVSVEETPRFPATIDEIEEDRAASASLFDKAHAKAKADARAMGVLLETHIVAGHPVPAIAEFVKDGPTICSSSASWGTRSSTTGSSAARLTDWLRSPPARCWSSSERALRSAALLGFCYAPIVMPAKAGIQRRGFPRRLEGAGSCRMCGCADVRKGDRKALIYRARLQFCAS